MSDALWPQLPPLADWEDTSATVHLWTQVVGKVRLAAGPNVNHWWGAALYVTPRGLTTGPMPSAAGTFQIDFDFIAHALHVTTSGGQSRSFDLEPMSVADFYRRTMDALDALGLEVAIWPVPVELPEVTPFAEDTEHASYDADAVHAFWRALVAADRVFQAFRARYVGKSSPSHFFWGGFDLAVTRFSGRPAPPHPGGYPNVADWVMREAYSHEVASAGFWPGTGGLDAAAFYAYAYPAPDGFADAAVEPSAAYFHGDLGEFVLPYDAVRASSDPDAALMRFLESTYAAAADLGGWDRAALERRPSPLP